MREVTTALALAAGLLLCTCASGAEPPDPAEKAWEACNKAVVRHKFDSDFDSAVKALRRFLADHPGSARAAEARKQVDALKGFAEKQIQGIYANARSLSDKRRFDLALELYTEIITRAPSDEWVKKAREGIQRNDRATEPLFKAVKKKCDALFERWAFSDAVKMAAKSAGDLTGTKWAEPASRMLMEAEGVKELFAGLARKVEKTKDRPKKTPFKVKDLSGWFVRGKITKIDERGFICTVTGAGKTYLWKDLLSKGAKDAPKGFLEIVDLYELEDSEQLALGILLYRRGFKPAATQRLKLAQKNAELSEVAGHYLDLISGTFNRVVYDFSSGLQLMDWQAGGGRWRIVRGQLVQESENGEGELSLVSRKYKSKEVRFFYEMTVKANRGLVSVVLVQDEKNSFGFAFSPAQGYSAFASVDGQVRTVKNEKFRLPNGKKVRVRCGLKGDTFALSVGRHKMPRLTMKGLGGLEGSFELRTLDSRARFDNIVIRNVKE
jgi:hypothetical protein